MVAISTKCWICLVLIILADLCLAQKPELVLQTGHADIMRSFAFNPDGRILASASGDHTIKLWDVASGRQLRTLVGHSKSVASIAFSPDGRTLASGSDDRTIKVWDVIEGTQLLTLEGQTLPVVAVAFSPGGQYLAIGSIDNTILLWNVASGAVMRDVLARIDGHIDEIAVSPDGKTLAISNLGKSILFWNLTDGGQRLTLTGHASIARISFSVDGKILASCGGGLINLWDVASGMELRVFTTPEVTSVALSPDGKTLASGTTDTMIQLWDVATGTLLRTLAPFGGGEDLTTWVDQVAFSPDGRILASGSKDYSISLWNVTSGKKLQSLPGTGGVYGFVAFSSDGKSLAITNDNAIKLWDTIGGTQRLTLVGHEGWISSVAFSPNGEMLASGGDDNSIKLWDVESGREQFTLTGHDQLVGSVAFSPDSRTLASGSVDNTIKLWDVAAGRQLHTFKGHSSAVTSIAFSPDRTTLASGSTDKTIRLWNVTTGGRVRTLLGHSSGVLSIAFSPNGKLLASAGGDFLQGAGSDHAIRLWDAVNGVQLRKLNGHRDIIKAVAFSPDGKILATSSQDHSVKLWDVATGTELHTLSGDSHWVTSVAFSKNNAYLAGIANATVTLWDVNSGREVASLMHVDHHSWVVTTPDGLFDGSPVAWNKILWRFNNNTFDYASVETFFGDFYYPGLLVDIFAGKNPIAPTDIAQKDRRQPQVRLSLSDALAEATFSVKVKIDVTHALAGAHDVRLFRNGSLIKVWHGDVLKGQSSATLEATIPIVSGENHLTAYAFNHDNIKSGDASLVVNGAANLKRAGTLYVLAIGSNKYKSAGYDLRFALADVDEISQQVKAYQDKLSTYARTEIISITDAEATKANVLLALRRFSDSPQPSATPGVTPAVKQLLEKIRTIGPEDGLFIYYAGHGTAIGERFYLLPHDFVAGNEAQLKASSISDLELNDILERVDAGKLLMVIDSCQSGQALGGEKEGRGPMNSKGLAQLAYDKGMYILTAAQSYQAALEVSRSQGGQKIEHGLLTFALLEGFTKAKPDGQGRITERNWMNYAVDQVPLMQMEEMKKRTVALEQQSQTQSSITPARTGKKSQRGAQLVFIHGDNTKVDPEKRNVQRPRVFYRRELEARPLIVAKPIP